MEHRSAFTLIEIAIVLVIAGLMYGTAAYWAVPYIHNAENMAAQRNLETLEHALDTYVLANNRLPCPGNATLTEISANFGKEALSPTQNVGDLCQNGSIAAVHAGGETMAGVIPAVTLGLPASAARDPWGNLIEYYVDRRMTKMDAFSTYAINDTVVGDLTMGDLASGTRTTKAIYALVSHGSNQLGAFMKSGARKPLTSTDSYEQENYDFDGTSGDRVLVQGFPTGTSDDLVKYKTRMQIRTVSMIGEGSDLSGTGDSCASQVVNWTEGANSCSGNVGFLYHSEDTSVVDATLYDMGSVTVTCNDGVLEQADEICAHTPMPCASTTRNWTAGGDSCTQTVPALTHGQTQTLTDSTASATGTSDATCTDGTLGYANEVCYASCASQAVNWTQGGNSCTGTSTALDHNDAVSVADSTLLMTGGVTVTCNDGTLDQSSASCGTNGACAANGTYSWIASGNTCTSSVADLANGGSSALTDSTQPTTGGVTVTCTTGSHGNSAATCNAQCAASTANWTVSGQSCSSAHGAINHGSSSAVTDSVANSTGAATLTCTNGVISKSGTSCVTSCAAGTANWTVSGQSCTQTYAALAHGGSSTVTDSTAPTTGSATLTCTNGSVAQSGTSCVPHCAAQTVNWSVGGYSCTGTSVLLNNGSSAVVTDSTVTDTGKVTTTCTSGVLVHSGQICTAPVAFNVNTATGCISGYCYYDVPSGPANATAICQVKGYNDYTALTSTYGPPSSDGIQICWANGTGCWRSGWAGNPRMGTVTCRY
jgi:type II secretory pathway pseudopilin PulG